VATTAAVLAASFVRSGARTVALIAHAAPAELPSDVVFHHLSAIEPSAFPPLLAGLRRQHDVTILAPAHGSGEHTFLAIDQADRLLLLSDLSVAALRDLQRTLRLHASLGHPYDTAHVVLQGDADRPVSLAEAAAVLKREIYWHLPEPDAPTATASMDALARKLLTEKQLGN
jgi:hypothetical protein